MIFLLKNKKNLIIGGVAIIVLIIVYVVYRMYFMFDKNTLHSEISTQSKMFGDSNGATSVISKEVSEILSSQSQTMQVTNYAKLAGQTKESVLAQTATNNAISKGFLAHG